MRAADFFPALEHVRSGGTLDAETSTRVFDIIMSGEVPESDLADFLVAQAERGPTVDEIVGAARSMRAHMREVTATPLTIDLCGTGGDGHGTFNISTAVSFLVAGAGVPVAKHGNRAASSKSGAADILEALGVKIDLEPDTAARVLTQTGLVFLFAQTYHPSMRHVAAVRSRIGRRTIFNLLGPLANPARVTRQLVGIFAEEWLTPYAEALKALGCERAMVVHGKDGLDEFTTTDATFVAKLADGTIIHSKIVPEDAGLKRATLAQLKGGTGAENAAALRRLLDGEIGAYRDIVLLNASAALMVAERASELKAGIALAAHSIDSGAAKRSLENLIAATNA